MFDYHLTCFVCRGIKKECHNINVIPALFIHYSNECLNEYNRVQWLELNFNS